MKIELTHTAEKQLAKLPKTEARKIIRKLQQLPGNPYSTKKLEGKLQDRYVIRAWPYRIIYVVKNNTIQIDTIEHRQGVYK